MQKKYKKVFSLSLQSGYRNYTVRDLLESKGKKKLTQINVTTPEEAAAAEEAGIDLIIAGPPSPMKKIREAAPKTFFTCGLNWTEHESKESVVRKCLELIELGLDSLHCGSWNMEFVKYLSQFRIPIQGHVGLVPMKSTWTGGVKPFGKTSKEAEQIYKDIKELDCTSAWAVEVECVPKEILVELTKTTKLLTISIGSGNAGDVQFLFAEDILGHSLIDTPRHAKIYRNFNKIFANMQ
ncbi:3-methyl-2-oxobutanoate hydroxymethyltransferase, partial [Alphaproteobacteria bacterium]|nr:3-methyl-2-oxobutanoate hydroxymethyltransferase [Alphaproteobacteria bacterium]